MKMYIVYSIYMMYDMPSYDTMIIMLVASQ
jgi:hypothetical protein